MNLRKQLSSYIALNDYVEAIKSGQLPTGYTELEYIESTGTQYIDTGIKASDCYGIYADFTPLGTNGLSGVFGSNTASQNGTSLWLNNSSSVAFYIRPNTLVALSPQISINNILNTRCVFSMLNRVATFTYNNVTSSGTYNLGTTTYDTTIKVCGCSAYYDNYSAKAKYNKFMLYGENNTLVRNFIPAKRNSDNVLGMYDTISGTFFTNSGIGSFVAGPEVYKSSIVLTDAITNGLTDLQLKGSEVKNKPEVFLDSVVAKGGTEQRNLPAEYTQLEYITFPSGAYIKTGIVPKTFDYEVGFKGAFGILPGGPNCAWGFMSDGLIPRWVCATYGSSYLLNANTTRTFGNADTNTHTFVGRVYEKNGIYCWSSEFDGVIQQNDQTLDNTANWEANTLEMYVGARNNNSTAGNYGLITANHWWCKKAGVMIADYIPAKRNSDNVLGMYDTVSGTFFTNQGTGTFTAGPEVVPTPDTPIDITSNNGVLKVRHQSGLPLGYTLLDYVESTGTQYINTGVVLGQDYTNTNIKLEYDALINKGANWQVCGTAGTNGIYIGVNQLDIICYGAGFNDVSTGVTNPFVKCKYINDAKNGVIKVTNLSTDTDIVNLTYTPVTKTTVLPMILFGFSRNATTIDQHKMSGKMYNAKIYNNNELIRHFIPAKRLSDSVIGMYDTVSGTFFINQGTGEFIAGNPVNDFEVYTDGTVETIKSHGKNLCDSNAFQSGYVNPNDGTICTNPQWLHTDYLYIGDAETYTYSLYTSVSGNAGRECAFYDKDKKFISGSATFITTNHVGEASKTFTVPEGTKYIRISVANLSESQKDTKVQLEQGATPTEYEPYFNGGTATAEMLLKVGTYQDEQEILSGNVTRKIGVKVLDGTESWTMGQSFYCDTLTGVLQADHSCYCTHYQGIMNTSAVVTDSNTCSVGYHIGSDIDWNRLCIYADRSLYATAQDFANYLADQYAAGTPVIVIYPLNASTTETVSPQKLFKNPVTVTEASIDNLEVTTTEAEHTVPTPDYPLDIVCNNGVLKVSPNLFDKNASYALFAGYLNNKSVGGNTTLMDYSGGDKTIIIKVAPNTTYTVTRATDLGSVYDRIRCAAFTTLPKSGSTGVILCNYMNTTQANATFTTLSDTQYVAINVRNGGAVGDDWTQFVDAFQLEQGSTATQYRPYGQIYTDGTVETITITGKNLFNESHIKSVVINNISVVIPVKQNKTYTWSYNKTEYDFRFDSDFVWGIDLNGSKVENGVTLVYANGTYTTASYVTVTVVSPNVVALQTIFRNNIIQSTRENVLASSMQLEEGIRPTKYEEYYQASFAPEDLLKLSDYQDVQSVLDGVVTRNVGIKVFDGTEDWTQGAASPTFKASLPVMDSEHKDSQDMLCSHFKPVKTNVTSAVQNNQCAMFTPGGATAYDKLVIGKYDMPNLTAWKQWLADQYANGTPVIVVYPLADTVEETVESRDVFITSGTNTIERNSEYVSSNGITVKYKKLR